MAAQDAELKLKVSLDLAFFRQQLSTIGAQLGGQALQLNVKFDKKSIADQYRLLDRYIGRKTFKAKIESPTLDALVAKVEKFKENLQKLEKEDVKLNVDIESKIKRQDAAEARRNLIASITGPKGAVFIPIEVKPPLVKNINAIRKDIKERLSGIVVEVEAKLKGGAQIQSAGAQAGGAAKRPTFIDSPAYQAERQKIANANAQTLAKAAASLPSGRNRQEAERLLKELEAQNLSKEKRSSTLASIREFIARARYQQGMGFEARLEPIRGQRGTSAPRSMPNLNQMLDRIANLTENPRAAQHMLRMMPESRLTTDLIGAANRQAAFREQYGPQGFRLPGFGGAKAFDPLLKSIAESFTDYTRTVNASNPWVGKIGSGITQLIGRALTQSPEQMFGGRTPVAGAKLLPAAGQTSGTRLIREQFAKANLPLLQAPSVGQENAPLSRAATYMLNKANRALGLPIGPSSPYAPNPFAGMATVPGRQYFRPTMQPALPAAGMTGGSLSVLERQLAQVRGPIGTGGGIASALFSGRALVNPGVSMLSPMGIAGPYRQMAAALAGQAANPALAHRQIADIGFGAVPASATGLSGQALNAALNQAYFQRRGLGVTGAQSIPIFSTQGVAVQQNIPGMAYQMSRPQSPFAAWSQQMTAKYGGVGAGSGAVSPRGGGGRGGFGGMGGFGGFGGMGGFGGFGRAMGGINLPGAGTIRELGSEFAFATKQVLLFGQAYKMLGFIQAFPGQVGQAVAQLQSFRNTLNTVATSADDAAASNRLILDLVEKYNVPLQSARDGFTKLYASMAPAGFSGDEIRDLFTGITQAAATFGMSADKVDRVNYAFAQMASKGQVMSEELKGQLGDVLPGAMAIFAEAAGFEGPKAIQEFSAALEDGVYKGEAMNVLLKNVGIVMKKEFGPGAEGAARTFQGVINRMQNSMQLLYESFEPVAVGFLNSVVMPLTNGIKQISDGFTSFFTGAQAQTTGGFQIAQELEKLRPAFDGIRQNAAAVASQFKQFAQTALELAKVLLQIAGNPITGYLVKLYAIALPINMALNVMRGLWISNAAQLLIFNARVAAGTSTLTAFRGMMSATGATAATTATAIRTAGLTLRTFFASTGVGIVIVGISMLIEKFMSMNQALDDTRAKAIGAAQAIRAMSQTEAIQAKRSAESGVRLLETLQQRGPSYAGSDTVSITEKEGQQLRNLGIPVSRTIGGFRAPIAMLESYKQRLQTVNIAEAESRIQQLNFEGQQSQSGAVLAAIPSVADEEKAGKGKGKGGRKSLDQLVSSQILMLAEAEKAAIRLSLAQTKALAPDTTQARRILDFYAKFRNNLVDIQAIEGQIAAAEKNRSKWIKDYGMTGEEIDRNLAELRNQLKIATIDLAATEQDYRNQAKADGAEEAAEMEEKLRKQKELNRLIEDAQIAAGIISPQDAAIRLQRRSFEDAQARLEAEGTPEQLAQLKAAQALIPEAGSIQETMKTLREELDKLLSAQEMVKFSAASIGEAFSTSFKDAITGAATAQEALAGFFQSVGNAFADMAAQMIQKMIQMYVLNQFLNILPGGGMFKGNASIQGGGFGSFSGGAFGIDSAGALGQVGQSLSITPFANGGVVTGPTMGLVGEGRYNEAVVPLPDGKTIPVDLGNAAGNQIVSNITVNVSNGQAQSNANGSNSSELGRKLEGAVKQVIVGELRPGGLLAR